MPFLPSKNKQNCFAKQWRKIEGKNFSQQLNQHCKFSRYSQGRNSNKNPQMKRIKYLKYPFPKDTASTQITEARVYGNVPGYLRSTDRFNYCQICGTYLYFSFVIVYLILVLVMGFVRWVLVFLTAIKLGPSRIASDWNCIFKTCCIQVKTWGNKKENWWVHFFPILAKSGTSSPNRHKLSELIKQCFKNTKE